MKHRYASVIGFFLLAAATTPAPCGASSLMRLSMEQLSQASTEIVRGQVTDRESRWNASGTQIETVTTLLVSQVVKGLPKSAVAVQQFGGTVGNVHQFVAGSVQFEPQAEYVLFLEPSVRETGRFRVVGMMQGAYRIYRDASHTARVINPQAAFEEFYTAHTSGKLALPSSRTTEAVPATFALTDFERRLATAMRTEPSIPSGTSLKVRVETANSSRAGQLRVLARTDRDVFPSSTAIVPAGSEVAGVAREVAGLWEIHWTAISVHGLRLPISGVSEGHFGGSLSGADTVIRVRQVK